MGYRGFFIIRPFTNKTVFKLNGNFDGNNVQWLKKAMVKSKSFHNSYIELDMQEVEDIDNQAMSFLTTTLKKLNRSGVRTKITGLDRKILQHH